MSYIDVAVVESGGANIGSVLHALERLGARAELTADANRIRSAPRVILPGVGAARAAMRVLEFNGLVSVLPGLTQPVLGICLGMQLLYEFSEEDDTPMLGIMRGRVEKLPATAGLRIPHMGWNRLERGTDDPLLAGLDDPAYAYFVHSFAAMPDAQMLAGSTHGREFAAVTRAGNFYGAQFHPERSATVGRRLLQNFLEMQ